MGKTTAKTALSRADTTAMAADVEKTLG